MRARGAAALVRRPVGRMRGIKRGGGGGIMREGVGRGGEPLVSGRTGHTPPACKTRGEIKCFINVIKVKSCLSNEPR